MTGESRSEGRNEWRAKSAPEGRRNPFLAAYRGLLARCPCCGQGKLFRAYLKIVDRCAVCGENLSHIRADDGPAWLTILIVGHVVVGLALMVEMTAPLPVVESTVLFVGLSVALILYLLPRAKGVFAGVIWAMDATGVDPVSSRIHAPPP